MLSPLESAEGILVTAAIRDISVRKNAETHLAQMEGRYRGLLEAAPDAMVVVGQGGDIVLLNVQAEKQFGYRRDELVGQKVKNIIPEGFAERLIADGTAHRGRSTGAADRNRDRTHRAAEKRQQVPHRDHVEPARKRRRHPRHGGHPRHQRAQDRGDASGADGGPYRGLLEAAPDAMVVVNQAGDIVLLNSRRRSSSDTAATNSSDRR